MSAEVQSLIVPGTGERGAMQGSVLFIGTATVLIRVAGITILTDPNFLHRGDRVYLGYGLHASRRTEPALDLDELPALDLVLLSHLHEDHFDRVVASRLDRSLPIVTSRHAARHLRREGFETLRGLSTWETLDVRGHRAHRVRVAALPKPSSGPP